MSDVFLDTGYVIALSDRKDSHHQEACELAEQISQERVQVVTTQDVLVEIGNGLAAVGSRSFAVRYIRLLDGADVPYSKRPASNSSKAVPDLNENILGGHHLHSLL